MRATTAAELQTWDATIDCMVRGRQLIVPDSRADPDISGRRHEMLAQYHQGIPVYGGGLSRETAQGVAVSILGTIFDNISTDSAPALSSGQAVASLVDVSGARLVGDAPQLIVFPMVSGAYRLAYRVTMSDMKTYVVDAADGAVLWSFDEARSQGQVGVGTGVLGDQKKVSTIEVGGTFRTHDQLRPAPIRTFDTRGSDAAFNRLVQPPGVAVDADFPVDTDNTWTDPAVVDTHVHAGWYEDFRAMTVMMPNVPSMRVAAQAAIQAANDLYGAGSAPANAIRQAMQAVGLAN